uniref:Uncharacterized protein n=1 Tax=Anguilla anguilla TaxID=7936 RepID=A0A0E9WRU9_ANGAN
MQRLGEHLLFYPNTPFSLLDPQHVSSSEFQTDVFFLTRFEPTAVTSVEMKGKNVTHANGAVLCNNNTDRTAYLSTFA